MARPIKKGLDYYPQDVDMFNDRKIKRLIAEFGAKGYIAYEYIKSRCFKENGYWVQFDDNFCFDISDSLKAGIDETLAMEVILGCIRIGLFNKKVFDMFKIITSSGIQKRYLEAKRTPVIVNEIWVIETETGVIAPVTPVIAAISTQSKVKESKGNKIIYNDDGAFLNGQRLNGYENLDVLKERVLKDENYTYPIVLLGIPNENIPGWFDAFHRWLLFNGEKMKQEKEYRFHFRNWITKIPNYKTANPEDYQPVTKPKAETDTAQITETERRLAEKYKQ